MRGASAAVREGLVPKNTTPWTCRVEPCHNRLEGQAMNGHRCPVCNQDARPDVKDCSTCGGALDELPEANDVLVEAEELRAIAEAGNPAVQYALGAAYQAGLEVAPDPVRAAELYDLAAAQGHPEAAYALAWAYADGAGVTRSKPDAVRWFRVAASRGVVEAHDALRCVFAYDSKVPCLELELRADTQPDHSGSGMAWLEKRSDHGSAEAQFTLGMTLVSRDPDEAVRRFRQAAAEGHPRAMLQLAVALACGVGVEKDAAAAVTNFELLAERGDAEAEHALATAHRMGWGAPRNPDRSMEWLRRAASHGSDGKAAMLWLQAEALHGNTAAQVALGRAYGPGLEDCRQVCRGRHLGQHAGRAAFWFRKAADLGDIEAQFCLGMACLAGDGVPRDPRLAVDWYRRAADHGHPQARLALAWCLANGQGTPQDMVQAAEWRRRASVGLDFLTLHEDLMWATVGDPDAQFRLYAAYSSGSHVPRDEEVAAEWLSRAAHGGCAEAQYTLGVQAEADARGVCDVGDPRAAAKWFRRAAELGHEGARLALARQPTRE